MGLKQTKIIIFEIIKWLSVIVLLIFLFSQVSSMRKSHTDFDTMASAVINAADLGAMTEGDVQSIKRLYGIDPDQMEGVLLYRPATNMDAEEILLVKLSDTSQQESVKSAIDARIEKQMNSFEGYGVTQYEMLQNAVIEVQGNYVLLVVAADPAPVRKAFMAAL